MVPETPPLIWRVILSPDAWPEAVPAALKVRSSQVPEMRLPLCLSLLLISTLEVSLWQRMAMPSCEPPPV